MLFNRATYAILSKWNIGVIDFLRKFSVVRAGQHYILRLLGCQEAGKCLYPTP